MKKISFASIAVAALFLPGIAASAQYRDGVKEEPEKTAAELLLEEVQSSDSAVVLSLEKALEIALSENVSVKVADMEITRNEYAKKGTYASLFPQIDLSGSYQRTIEKQVMYMDYGDSESDSSTEGISIGRLNTWSGGVTASMPLVNAQQWKNVKISALGVEAAVESARESRLQMVTEVKKAFFEVLLANEILEVYKEVYNNTVANFENTEKKYKAQKASELEYLRAKSNVASAIPDVFNAESTVILALWQLKAVIGIDLELEIDVEGSLADYTETMFRDIHENDTLDVSKNTTMRQLAIQAEQLRQTVKLQGLAYVPTLSLNFNYSYYAYANDFNFSEYRWSPYSYVGLSLNIPIFSGGKRYNDLRQAKVQLQEHELQMADQERNLRISMQNYLNTMELNMKSYYAAEEAVEAAQLSYNTVQKSYELGKSTLTDLNDAQLTLVQSVLSKNQAVYNFIVAKCELEELLGVDFIEEEEN